MSNFGENGNIIFKISCPVCKSDNVSVLKEIKNIPYYGRILLLTVVCNDCNYKFNDIYNLEAKTPKRYILQIKTQNDLNAKIIKGASCTIKIPELDIDITPGPASEGFITNVEGILLRIKSVLIMMKRSSDSPKEMKKITKKLDFLMNVLNGLTPLKLIIEDPLGVSKIISEKNLTEEILTDEEISNLDSSHIFSIEYKNSEDKNE